ncbi:rhomboid-domain-containing protein [Obba rivulosa]|uniref:Rhomboid-domain-containing protein n=1 Tax=Obba rivulosa TaxID=1052685 RepID=A0A8E2DPX3_9APHY|nr:rhomboid-domain-containing protein [Obba rivulosa]
MSTPVPLVRSRPFAAITPPSIPLVSEPQPHSPQSILHFLSSRIRYATHRDFGSSRHNFSGTGGPQRDSFWQRFRRRLDSVPSEYILYAVIALNAGVYTLWKYAYYNFQTLRDSRLLRWMSENFMVSLQNLKNGRIWTLLTACFSHMEESHALFNGLSFYFIAPALLSIMRNSSFLALYLAGGIAGCVTSVGMRWWMGRRDTPSLGASGAIYALVSYLACAAPRSTFYVFFVVPVPAWALLIGLFLYDGYKAKNGTESKEDAIGHLGGLAAGVAYYARLRFRLF